MKAPDWGFFHVNNRLLVYLGSVKKRRYCHDLFDLLHLLTLLNPIQI
jgi:hypothetical protein